ASAEAWGATILTSRVYLGIQQADGAPDCRIGEVTPKSPADKAGIKVGDLITSFDGQKVVNFGELALKLANHRPGDEVRIEVKRGEETVKTTITLAPRPRNPQPQPPP